MRGATRYADVLRAVVDAARRAQDLRRVRTLVLGSVCAGWCDAEALSTVVRAGGSGGSAVLRRAVRDAAAGAWSAPEPEAADLVGTAVAAGRLPRLVLNTQRQAPPDALDAAVDHRAMGGGPAQAAAPSKRWSR